MVLEKSSMNTLECQNEWELAYLGLIMRSQVSLEKIIMLRKYKAAEQEKEQL